MAEAWAGVVALGVQPGEVRTVPLSSVLRTTRRPINYRNPISIPGNIAGGEGFGDGGIDSRTVGGSVVVSRSAPASGGWFQRWNHRDITSAQFSLEYTINDTVDFCPGDPGSRLESRFTVPLSRLEATGPQWAVDVPITVRFTLDRHIDNGNPFADPNFNG